MQIGVNLFYLFIRMRSVIITGKVDRYSRLPSRQHIVGTIILLVNQYQFVPLRIPPPAKLRNSRYRRCRIHSDMKETDTGAIHRGNDAAGMPRNIRHLGGYRLFAVFPVQLMCQQQIGFQQIQIHRLGFHRIGNTVPDNVSLPDRLFQAFHVAVRSRLKIFPNQPGTGCPDISFTGTVRPQLFRHIQCFRNKLVDIAFFYNRAQIGEPDIEVCLKYDIDFRDLFVRLCLPGTYRQAAAQ